jgi:hypothetical protein
VSGGFTLNDVLGGKGDQLGVQALLRMSIRPTQELQIARTAPARTLIAVISRRLWPSASPP